MTGRFGETKRRRGEGGEGGRGTHPLVVVYAAFAFEALVAELALVRIRGAEGSSANEEGGSGDHLC